MNLKRISLFAWTLCGIVVLVTAYVIVRDLIQGGAQASLLRQVGDLLWTTLPMVFGILGTLIISRQPLNVIGWLMLIPAVLILIPSTDYLQGFATPPASPSLAFLLAAWFDNWSWLLLIMPLLLIPLLFPTGGPPSPCWRWVIVYAAGMTLIFVLLVTFSQRINSLDAAWSVPNPIGFIPEQLVEERFIVIWVFALGILTLLCLAALVVRYRRAVVIEREQIKWLLYACGLFAAVYVPALFVVWIENAGLIGDIWNLLFFLAILAIPAAIATAILRYRLWDIDVIIRKTLLYAVLTALLALVYFGSIALLQGVVTAVSGQSSSVVIVVSTLAIAALFAPLRRRIQNVIDRRFYRKKYDAEQVLARFAQTARDETDLDSLTAELARVVQEAMQPERVGVWLREAPEPTRQPESM